MDSINPFEQRNTNVFNTPLEIGLRILFILNAISPQYIDLNKLVIYDYFLLNSSDFPNGPKSIHPAIPHRSAQIIIKPMIMRNALILMKSKELLDVVFTQDGIKYKSNSLTSKFVELQDNQYSKNLNELSNWINRQFNQMSTNELDLIVKNNMPLWGSEFIYESLIRE